jgi:hypothetical protein
MFGLARLRTGSVMGVALTVCLLLVRIYLVRYSTTHGVHAALPDTGYGLGHAADQAAPVSAWLIFATTDRDTQVRTQHARLRAEAGDDRLDLQSVAHGQADAMLLLASLTEARCLAVDHVAAAFDGRPAEIYDAQASWLDPGCSVKIGGYERFVQGLLNAQTVALAPKAAGATFLAADFHVAGLTWGQE